MPLTDLKVRAAKAREKPYRLPDAGGLHLYVPTTGSRLILMLSVPSLAPA
ncbi:Arm DNA-binding domain-containing protein [Plastoroseomonas hellenica]|uniref:DUF4102 domain-containing protein n=1 Tax=Plastoroseomonas hellenica TaxID=2687306 RepID=A0ABS5EZ51_9PROT|nr:Arm DNA-binding domain-containing protein [Plastoroseomonas hellenica]MBR0642775.1 DUF4102 domain-containing protein [Plastoroseomonas hellenica]MBR0665566.1 DUF4102 domain-containing protein [Plastoroseomonas hellenica]